MKNRCKSGSSLDELLSRPAVELRLVGAEDKDDKQAEPDEKDKSKGTGDEDDKSKKSGEQDDDASKTYSAAEWARAQRKIAALEEEKTKHYNLRTDAEEELKTVQKELDKLKKDGMPSDAAKTELTKAEAEVVKLTGKVEKLSLQVAFLTANKHSWVDPKAALKLADLSGVKFDPKTDSTLGLDKALDDLAKEAPYLLKAEKSDAEKDAEKDDKKKPPATRTGRTPSDKQSGDEKSQQAKATSLRQKYSGLRR